MLRLPRISSLFARSLGPAVKPGLGFGRASAFRRHLATEATAETVPPTVMDMNHQRYIAYGKYLVSVLPKFIQQMTVYKDELTICVAPTAVIPVMTFLKLHGAGQFKQVNELCGVDYPTRQHRFEVVYNMLSVRYNAQIRVKTYCDELTPVPSVTPLFEGANWFEREAWDMYGIVFSGHPDLRRILTDYGFEGHPLRKDFPLTGYTEVRWDEELQRVVSEPLELSQEFRKFDFSSPWEQLPKK